MGLESNFQSIKDFNTAWPIGNETRLQGDDHIRGFKQGVVGDFAGFLAFGDAGYTPVTVTQAVINSIPNRVDRAGDTMLPGGRLNAAFKVPSADLEVATRYYVQQVFDGLIAGLGSIYPYGIGGVYRSAPTPFTTPQAAIEFPHGFENAASEPVVPDEITCWLSCVTDEHGYVAGDVVYIDGAQSSDTTGSGLVGGIQLAADTAKIYVPVGANIFALNKTSGLWVELTAANWRINVLAYNLL